MGLYLLILILSLFENMFAACVPSVLGSRCYKIIYLWFSRFAIVHTLESLSILAFLSEAIFLSYIKHCVSFKSGCFDTELTQNIDIVHG
jgi:hypothetical protein